MKDFAYLFQQLDQTTRTNAKINALAEYFAQASDQDKLWTVAILSHRRPRRTVKTTLLREWAAEIAAIPQWLFEETYHIVGDLAETIALLLPAPEEQMDKSLSEWIDFIKSLGALEEEEKKELVLEAWNSMEATERFVFNKLITGGFRMGVSQRNMTKALAKYTGIDDNALAHRLMGNWTPDSTTFEDLILNENPRDDLSKPYPFYLAYALDDEAESLGKVSDWQAERKWDGIRAQLIKRAGELFVWSRGEELVTDRFPEYSALLEELPDGTVIDGEVLPFKEGRPLPFQVLQTRIGRKKPGKKTLEKAPLILMAYDLLEENGIDIRELSMEERRNKLEAIHANCNPEGVLHLSPVLEYDSWEELAEIREDSRKHFSEGIMLKRKSSPYQSGRKKGDWWKWKVDPLTIDAVMIYAQRGHGRRANLYTDYTFAVWKGEDLVPFTKAYSGLTDKEIREVDRFVKANTLERFGPVRSVKAELVFEIAFEGINRSTRHKSGVALRFPRIHRWRQDKPKEEANTLEDLNQLLDVYGQ
ncbi:MAG: ATP-dependent DNA ligase [Bacteroidota bacterium]